MQPITTKAVNAEVVAAAPLGAALFTCTYKVRCGAVPCFCIQNMSMYIDSLCRVDSSGPTPYLLIRIPPPLPSLWYLLTIFCRLLGNQTAGIILKVFKCKVLGFISANRPA